MKFSQNVVYGITKNQETQNIHLNNNVSYIDTRKELKDVSYDEVDESHEYEPTDYGYDYVT